MLLKIIKISERMPIIQQVIVTVILLVDCVLGCGAYGDDNDWKFCHSLMTHHSVLPGLGFRVSASDVHLGINICMADGVGARVDLWHAFSPNLPSEIVFYQVNWQ